ncbi:MAG TPA: hypothetical protein DEP84_18275 [Chloroflexi bacterium]|nr:hypothetical protein [Chloroflexota bacterium]
MPHSNMLRGPWQWVKRPASGRIRSTDWCSMHSKWVRAKRRFSVLRIGRWRAVQAPITGLPGSLLEHHIIFAHSGVGWAEGRGTF